MKEKDKELQPEESGNETGSKRKREEDKNDAIEGKPSAEDSKKKRVTFDETRNTTHEIPPKPKTPSTEPKPMTVLPMKWRYILFPNSYRFPGE